MSKIDNLIAKLCPNGVEYKELQELFFTKNGYTPPTSNKEFWENGTIPWFKMEDIRINGKILSTSLQKVSASAVKSGKLFPKNSIIIATSATIGEHALITVPYIANQRFTALVLKQEFTEKLDIKFIFYYCFKLDVWCCNNITTSSFASVDMNGFKKFKFPIPPLEIQREIVKVLDTFTKLEAELEAELEARRRQYHYYRDQLLNFEDRDDVQWMTLGEVCDMNAGYHITASNVSGEQNKKYPFPCFGGNGIRGYVQKYSNTGPNLIVGRQGALCGNVQRAKEKFYATEHAVVVKTSNIINVDWFFHMLINMNLNQYASKSAQPGLAVGNLKQLSIPIPSLEEQTRVAGILDKFDALVNDLSSGLPAEIAARRKQYEHYRDRLLTFKEAQ